MKKRGECGFALLLVFLMAAAIAITLYMQIPRVAFQAQRQKEQLLIERGEQYKRAIQLFFRTNNRYPGELKDLESFNNRRFLRHKFIDPMTGKDDWRLVHINNGVLTDSVLNKKKPGDPNQQQASTAGQYVGEQAAIGATLNPGQQAANPALTRRRPSEGGPQAVGPDGQPIAPGQPIPGFPAVPGQPQPFPGQVQPQPSGITGFPGQVPPQPGVTGFPGQVQPTDPNQPFPGQVPGQINPIQAQPTTPGQNQLGPLTQMYPQGLPNPGTPIPPEIANQLTSPAQTIPGRVPGFTPQGIQPNPAQSSQSTVGNQSYVGSSGPYVGGGAYIGSQPATPITNPTPFTPNLPGQMNPQATPNQPGFPVSPGLTQTPNTGLPQTALPGQNPGAGMINDILRNPRPSQPGVAPGQPLGGQQIGGGIAGIASKSEDSAIMVYNDRSNYNEWEFVFDYTKQKPLPTAGGSIGTPAANLGNFPGTPTAGANPNLTANPTTGLPNSPNPSSGAPGQAPQSQGTQSLPNELRLGRP